MNVVFMGTPDFAVESLAKIYESGHSIKAVVCQTDKPVGRGMKLAMCPVKEYALSKELKVYQPEKIKNNTEFIEEIKSLKPDVIVVVAYGKILPSSVLDIPKYGCVNVHASLLPKLRGGAPIHRAIIDGYTKTGVTIMYMDEKMDEGDMISQKETEITETETAETLHDKLSVIGRDLLIETLPSIINQTNQRIKQNNDAATYGFIIKREDEKIDFSKTKKQIYDQIRGLNSWPGAYCLIDGKILKVWESTKSNNNFAEKINGEITNIYENGLGVKVSDGEIILTTVQPEGKKKMSAKDYASGMQNKGSLIGKILN